MARDYNFEFSLTAPITREEVSAWREREGIADKDEVPFELGPSGEYIVFRGDRVASGANLSSFLPRFRDWLTTRDIVMHYLRGDFCPPTFFRYNPWADNW